MTCLMILCPVYVLIYRAGGLPQQPWKRRCPCRPAAPRRPRPPAARWRPRVWPPAAPPAARVPSRPCSATRITESRHLHLRIVNLICASANLCLQKSSRLLIYLNKVQLQYFWDSLGTTTATRDHFNLNFSILYSYNRKTVHPLSRITVCNDTNKYWSDNGMLILCNEQVPRCSAISYHGAAPYRYLLHPTITSHIQISHELSCNYRKHTSLKWSTKDQFI